MPPKSLAAQEDEVGRGTVTSGRTLSLSSACVNVVKSAVGAGAIYIAAAFAKVGMVPGAALLVVCCCTVTMTLHLLGRVAMNTDTGSYFQIGRLAFGSAGELSANGSLLLFLGGALTVYAKLAGKFLYSSGVGLNLIDKTVATKWYSLSDGKFSIILAILVLFPLSCLRDLRKFAFTSVIGMLCILYIAIVTVSDYFIEGAVSGANSVAFASAPLKDFFGVFGTMTFAFVSHFTLANCVELLSKPTPSRRFKLITIPNAIAIALYFVFGVSGYLHFGDVLKNKETGDVLSAPGNDAGIAYIIGKIVFALVMLVSYPLLLDPARASLNCFVDRVMGKAPASAVRHYSQTAAIVAVTTFLAVLSDSVMDVIEIASTLFGSFLVYIFPAAYFLRLSQKFFVHPWERAAAWSCITLGLVLFSSGVYYTTGDIYTKIFSNVSKKTA